MFRYATIIWNEKNAADTSRAAHILRRMGQVARDLRMSFECPGMKVLCALPRERMATSVCQLWGESGVILGTVFGAPELGENRYSTKISALQQGDTERILDSGGKELIEKYWGRYVAFIRDPQRATKMVIRDPTGGLPCFVHETDGITVAFSSFADCLRTGLFDFTLNWRHVAARIAMGSLPLSETGLNECTEVGAGSCLRIADRTAVQVDMWNPLARGIIPEPLDDVTEAATQLRALTQSCMNSWASCYDSVLLDISGGLDSAIVAGCLAKAPIRPKVAAIKLDAQALPAETRRAQRVAQRAGFELVNIEVQDHPIAIDRLLTADPTVNLDFDVGVAELLDAKVRLADERGAPAILNGIPGDSLFGASTKEFGALDYVHQHGLNRRALKVALDVALMTDRSWWSVLAEALRKRRPASATDLAATVMANRPLASDHARQFIGQYKYAPHSMVTDAVPPGTSEFLLSFTRGVRYYSAFETKLNNLSAQPEPVYVLGSQPLIELCLRIPSYIKNENGRDRWVAREAFRNELPEEIVATLWKDPVPRSVHSLILRSMASIRELLNDGMLVSHNMVDKRKLEEALTTGAIRRSCYPSDIHDLVVAEVWLRRMTAALENNRRPLTWPAAVRA